MVRVCYLRDCRATAKFYMAYTDKVNTIFYSGLVNLLNPVISNKGLVKLVNPDWQIRFSVITLTKGKQYPQSALIT